MGNSLQTGVDMTEDQGRKNLENTCHLTDSYSSHFHEEHCASCGWKLVFKNMSNGTRAAETLFQALS